MKYIFIAFLISFLSLSATEGFLTEEEIALFHKQGYIVKQNCFSRNEMDELDKEVNEVIDRSFREIELSCDLVYSNQEQIAHLNQSRIVFLRRPDRLASIVRINGCTGIDPDLLKTMRSEKMLYTFFELLGTNDLEHLISQLHPKLPGDGIDFPRHRDVQFRKALDPDWNDIMGNGSYAICIIPIDPMNEENDGIWIDQNYPVVEGAEEKRIWIHAQPGDLLFMNPYVYHGSGPNCSTTTSRRTLLTGFCAFGANHKRYPGAHVNTRITLEEGKIMMEQAPWSQTSCSIPIGGH